MASTNLTRFCRLSSGKEFASSYIVKYALKHNKVIQKILKDYHADYVILKELVIELVLILNLHFK